MSRLVGAPPGYVGHEEAGQLTEVVRRHPYSLLLLDEVEKAHPDVFNILLQVLDDGRLTDSQGRTVDFTNTVIVMTSNLGSEAITRRGAGIGFGPGGADADEEARREQVLRPLREHFRPEFLNRIDEIVIFRQLTAEQLRRITDLMLDKTRRMLQAQDIDVSFTDGAVDWLAQRGFQPEYGARPLRRTIQREVDNQLSRLLLDGRIERGGRVVVDTDEGRLAFRAEPPARREPAVAPVERGTQGGPMEPGGDAAAGPPGGGITPPTVQGGETARPKGTGPAVPSEGRSRRRGHDHRRPAAAPHLLGGCQPLAARQPLHAGRGTDLRVQREGVPERLQLRP